MTFLNPLLLVALAASAIPLLLHLRSRRRGRVVEFSSLRFVEEREQQSRRALRVEHPFLLLLRVLLVAALVVAFARPAIRSSVGLVGMSAPSAAVILLDNSLSMGTAGTSGERFARARRAAQAVAETMERKDQSWILPLASIDSALRTDPIRSPELLRASIDRVRLLPGRGDLEEGLRAAARLLERSAALNREVYVITDGQRSGLPALADSTRLFPADVRVTVIPIDAGSRSSANLSIDSVAAESAFFQIGVATPVRAWVRNHGDRPAEAVPVTLRVDGEEQGRTAVTVPAGGTAAVLMNATPRRAGFAGVELGVSGDALAGDNRRWIVLPVAQRVRVVLAGSAEAVRTLGALFDLMGGAVSFETMSASALGSIDPVRTAAVVVADETPDGESLARFVENGGGLVIYAGPGFDRARFNAGLGRRLGVAFEERIDARAVDTSALRFTMVEQSHPLFTGVFDPTSPGVVESPRFTALMPPSGGETVIRLGNGRAFVSEFRRGRGRIIAVGAPPATTWGDFPQRAIVVPIATRSVLYVGARNSSAPEVECGRPIAVPLPVQGTPPEQLDVRRPDGVVDRVAVRVYPTGPVLPYTRTDLPGIYRVERSGETVAAFTAAVGARESQPPLLEPRDLGGRVGAHMADPSRLTLIEEDDDTMADAIRDHRIGAELWRIALAIALLCAIAELWVGRK